MSGAIDYHELESRLQTYDWNQVMYDPLQDIIEASTDEEKQELADMQHLLDDLLQLYYQSPEQATPLMEKFWKDTPMEHWLERIKDEAMTRENLERLKLEIKELGFPSRLNNPLEYHLQLQSERFVLLHKEIRENDSLSYVLSFHKEEKDIVFKAYLAILRKPIILPDKNIGGVDIKALDAKMSRIDWSYDQHLESIVEERLKSEPGRREIEFINETLRQFDSLYESKEGKEIAALLSFKHWSEGFYSRFVVDRDQLTSMYEKQITVAVDGYSPMNITEAYQILKSMKSQDQDNNSTLIKALENRHVIHNDVLNKAERAALTGDRVMVYNTGAYFLSSRQVEFFESKEAANKFILENESKPYKMIEFDSVKDMLKKLPHESIVAEPQAKYFLNSNSKTMNEQNMQYLKDNIKYMGFGEGLHAELERNLKAGKADFQLHYKGEMNQKPFEATLNFRKSDNTDMYFFNSYHAKMERSNGDKMEQTIYLDKGKGITAKEAFNLLEGRSVHKELTNKENVPYKAWLQLDFDKKDKHNNYEVKQFHENYGYDLRAAVGRLSVQELADPDKEKSLLQSLQKGNVQSVTIDKDGSSVKMFIEANPQFKTVNLYDSSMKRIPREDLVQYQSRQTVREPEQSLDKEQGQKKTPGLKQEKDRQSLLPKKRTSQKKGLGMT